ncbi:MAG: DUF3800 domain-containing protein [archaeon]
MRLFLDESNIPRLDKINPSSPYFIMGGCMIENRDMDYVHESIKKFATSHFPEFCGSINDFKIHAAAMYNLRDHFSAYTAIEMEAKINAFLDIINELPLKIVATAIHKKRQIERYPSPQDPYTVAFLYCCERFQWELSSKNIAVGEVVLESRGPGLDNLYHSKLEEFLKMGTRYTILENIAKPSFHQSGVESPLQISDFVCYAVHKYPNKNESELFDKIKRKFRQSESGTIEGYGLIQYPK